MIRSEFLKKAIINQSAKLAVETDECVLTLEECIEEYSEQLADGSYLLWLRAWIGYMIEEGNKKAIEIMKDLINYRLALKAENK